VARGARDDFVVECLRKNSMVLSDPGKIRVWCRCARSATNAVHPFGNLAAVVRGDLTVGPWFCVPSFRRVCRFVDEKISGDTASADGGAGRECQAGCDCCIKTSSVCRICQTGFSTILREFGTFLTTVRVSR